MIFSLDGFKFTAGVIPETLKRATDYKISETERVQNHAALFAVSKQKEEITISARTLPLHGAGNKALEPLYALAEAQKSCTLVDGRGKLYGKYVIVSIEEELELFMPSGEFLSQTFSITLLKDYDK